MIGSEVILGLPNSNEVGNKAPHLPMVVATAEATYAYHISFLTERFQSVCWRLTLLRVSN